MGPLFASKTHGYDTLDHFLIDPRLGTLDDFNELIRACQERGLKVMLDGIFNHVGAEHPLFRSALPAESHSPESEFFRID
jgi:cyclomaltodextrinase / maltogenic alpha-amylase / neopullulanase